MAFRRIPAAARRTAGRGLRGSCTPSPRWQWALPACLNRSGPSFQMTVACWCLPRLPSSRSRRISENSVADLPCIVERAGTIDLFKRPAHPYTTGLFQALPRLDDAERQLVSMPGRPPELNTPPEHCSFLPRCPYANQYLPQQSQAGPAHDRGQPCRALLQRETVRLASALTRDA